MIDPNEFIEDPVVSTHLNLHKEENQKFLKGVMTIVNGYDVDYLKRYITVNQMKFVGKLKKGYDQLDVVFIVFFMFKAFQLSTLSWWWLVLPIALKLGVTIVYVLFMLKSVGKIKEITKENGIK